jgi:hypothetical protein
MEVHFKKRKSEPGARVSVVIEALYYKPEGRWFENRWGEWIFSIYLILPAALDPGVYSASNRNEYQKQKNNISESRARPVRKTGNLISICEPIV